ncbi:MAG TPA: TIR domain-containing protein [Longimicrobium sp.]|jgi:tetratricopeptide (TPR) repeat protein
MTTPAYDVFISHSNADKRGFVELLAERLQRAGIRVWYDDFVVAWGDSISSSIARGLAESRYGIVVLSRSFLAGGWARHELRGLWQREIHDGKTILPILHDISHEEVRAFDPSLADMRALDTSKHDLEQIIAIVLKFLRGEAAGSRDAPRELLDVQRLADLARLGREDVLKRLERYGKAARLTPGSGEVVLGLGLAYLHLKRFPEAAAQLASAVQLLPVSGKAHLYYALSLLRARKPRSLSLAEARQILRVLETSTSLDPRDGLCDLFALVIKQEYFRANGLHVPPPDIPQHLRAMEQKHLDPDELAAFRGMLHDSSLLDALVH